MGNFSLETSGFDESKESMSGEMSVDFGPIRLNLVDVEGETKPTTCHTRNLQNAIELTS
jgi:hypothetical protein